MNSWVPKRLLFHGAPGHFEAARPPIAGADAVRPVVVRGEIASGPAQDGDVQLLRGVEHIAAEAVRIGERGAFVEHAAFDAAAEVFDEIAVDFRIDVADDALGIDLDPCLQGFRLRAKRRNVQCKGRGERESELAAGKHATYLILLRGARDFERWLKLKTGRDEPADPPIRRRLDERES